MTHMDAEKKLASVRTGLLMAHPFFGSLSLYLSLIENNEIKTMATDGNVILWNRQFVDSLTRDELTFVFVHEIMHCCLGHHYRQQGRDTKKWNIATDFAINGELVEVGIGRMPKGGLLNHDFTGRPAEEIYALLPDQPQQSQGGGASGSGDGKSGGKSQPAPGEDPGACGGVMPAANPADERALAEAEAEMQVRIKQAAAIAKRAQAGDMPASMARLIDQLLEPVVDWRSVLRRFVDESATRDYAWSRPNRRFLSVGLILPGLVADGLNHLVVAVDTSGSINNEVLQRFASEINGAFGDGTIDKITVIYADAAVQRVDEFERGDIITMDPAGGGGTRFSPTFDWIARNAGDVSAIIYFTDLECSDFGQAPAAPTLWAVYGDSRRYNDLIERVPFGECLSVAA